MEILLAKVLNIKTFSEQMSHQFFPCTKSFHKITFRVSGLCLFFDNLHAQNTDLLMYVAQQANKLTLTVSRSCFCSWHSVAIATVKSFVDLSNNTLCNL